MSKSYNKIQLIGYLGRNPELKRTPKDKIYTRLSIATTDGQGEYQKTNWHQVTLWGKNAEAAAQYLVKGSTVFIEGILGYNDYEKAGVKVHEPQITAFQVIYLNIPVVAAAPAPTPVDDEVPW